MSTSLKRQLAALAAPSSSLLVPERRRSSIIFSSQDAAKYDRETFYQIGQDGLHELVSMNPALFEPFVESILFTESSKKYERVVEDNEANEKLNETINEFLLAVHPYVMMKASLKCLEWLVHRFHIERFNVNEILQCVLPYYDTKTFVMIVQVLEIERYQMNQEWEWLIPCKSSGAPLRKAVLFDNSNSKFILWMFSTFHKIMHVHRKQPENLRIFLGFMASTIVGILNKLKQDVIAKPKKVHNQKVIGINIMSKIFELLTTIRENDAYQNLKNNEEIYSMAYVAMTMLAVCCREIPGLTEVIGPGLKQIFKLIIVNRGTVQMTETFLLMNLMIDFLNRKWEFNNPTTFTNALKDITKVSQNWNVSNLATKLILHNMDKEKLLPPKKIFNLVNEIELSLEARTEILRQAYIGYRKNKSKKQQAKGFLTRFEKQYPMEFELASEKDGTLATDLTKCKGGKDFIALSNHPSPLVRAKAVKRLIEKVLYGNSKGTATITATKKKKPPKISNLNKPVIPDKNRTAITLVPRFADDEAQVLLTLWKTKLDKLLKIFSPNSLVLGVVTTLKKGVSIKSNQCALQKLCGIALLENTNADLLKQILIILVPFLFPRNGKQMKLTKTILKTRFAASNPFLQKYAPIIEQENLTFQELCQDSHRLISLLDDNCKPELISTLETATQATFACILLPSEDIFNKLLPSAEKMSCTRCTNFPTTGANFYKCVKLAEHRHQLSFELVLTTLSKVPCKDFEQLYTILKFVWLNCEQIENREAGMKFLQKYLKTCCFDSSSPEQFKFWIHALRQSSESDCENNEFFLIRTIQFATAFIKKWDGLEGLSGQRKVVIDQQPKTGRTRKSVQKNQKANENVTSADESCSVWELVEVLLTGCLSHESFHVRSSGLDCLKTIQNGLSDERNVIGKFLTQLLEYTNEIRTDPDQIVNAMSHILTDSSSPIKSEIITSLKQRGLTETKKIGLLNLCSSISGEVFKEVYPDSKESFLNNPCSKYMLKLLSCYDGSFNEALLTDVLSSKDTARVVLKQIDKAAFESYNSGDKKKIFNILIDKTLSCKSPEVKVAVLRCVRKWALDASIVAAELTKCLDLEKRQTLSKNSKTSKEPQDDWVARAEVTLEFIQGKQQLKNKTKLIQPLFKILKKCIALEEQIPVEYLKQLVLTSLTICCQEEDALSPEESKDFVSFDVQTVIDCLRCSRNPQTHHHALILLNYAASRYHEQVLHGIMSLFTFMGNSILRQDDAYSTQLIQQTVINIIPALAKTNKGEIHRLNVSAGIFRVFTSAVQDIPVHRRLPVFTSLVQTLDPSTSMWQLCIILVDNALQRDRKRSNLNADLELAVDLVWNFGPTIVAQTVRQIYGFLISLPVFIKMIESEQFNQMKLRQTAMERSVLDFGRKESFRDVLITINFVLELVAQICSKFADIENEQVEYDALLEKCLLFSKKVSGLNEEKLFRLIAHKNLDVIDKINAALDPLKFIEAVALILVRDDSTVKRKVLEMLNQRILQKVEWFGELHHLLDLVPLLIEIANTEAELSDEATTLVQTAFFSLKLLAKHLAIQHPDDFIPVFELASKHTKHGNKLLRASAILCLSELFCLKSLILPNLHAVTVAILKAFKASAKLQTVGINNIIIEEEEEEGETTTIMESSATTIETGESSSMTAHLLCISTMTCLNKMIEHLGSFVGMKFLRKALIAVLSINSRFGAGEKATHRKKVFDSKLKALLKVISVKIPLRNMMIPIREAFSSLLGEPSAASTLMIILKDALSVTSKADFALCAESLTESFIGGGFLAIRENTAYNDNFEEVENAVIDCLISGMVLKMTESHFRPLYHKIFDWAKESESRLITFYRFSASAAERLKSLFVTFAGYVINEAIHVIHKDVHLAKAIVRFFYFIFSNDKEGFVTTDRFNALVQPLLDLVESDYVLNGDITISQVNECIVQLAVATNDLNRWQHLIELIALKAGHSNKAVRLNVLSTLEAAANELAKDFLPLLSPAVPFLAELMNDDEPEVESETQKLLLKLEEIVGEPLQNYFTT